jgi:hypothetical protein
MPFPHHARLRPVAGAVVSLLLTTSIAFTSFTRQALAEDTLAGPAAATSPPPGAAEEAKRYFEQGESLRTAGKYQAALEAYQKSRLLVPRPSNTLNVAVCLFNLGRLDEAYEFFEEALTKFPEASISKDVRDAAKGSMTTIETKVGRIDVSANVDGTLVIDGRNRGKVPLAAPLRVMPGKRVVRVLRDGFETFEQTVEVKVGETTTIDAKLNPLTSAGRLRVEGESSLDGATLTVDAAVVGTLPWEGTLAPGTHVCTVAKGDVGTGPALANVIVGQTVKITLVGKPLGPERRFVADPATADLSIDGIAVGKGRFQGRLPVGAHVIEAREPGYVNGRTSLTVDASDSSDFTLTLKVDEAHPRWRSGKVAGRFGGEIFAGYAKASTFGNDATWCADTTTCTRTTAPTGFRAGVGGLYELQGGLAVYARAGWMQFSGKISRQFPSTFKDNISGNNVATTYDFAEDLSVSGPFAGLGIGYRLKLGGAFDLNGRVLIDAAFVGVRDTVTGTGSGGGRTLAVATIGSGSTSRGLMLDVVPEIAAGYSFGPVRVSLGVAFPISLIDGPAVATKETAVSDPSADKLGHRQAIDNAPIVSLGNGLPGFSRFVTIVPQAGVGFWF